MFWATGHYLLAVSSYPYDFLDHYTEALRRKFLLSAMLATVVIVTMVIRTPMAMRISGWLLFGSILTWPALVRNIQRAGLGEDATLFRGGKSGFNLKSQL